MGNGNGWRQRLNDRVYGDVVRRWQQRELDDKAFERAYRWRAQAILHGLFTPAMLLVVGTDWFGRPGPFASHLERLPMWLILYAVFTLAIGIRIDRFARFGVRDQLLRRHRTRAEQRAEAAIAEGHVPEGAGLKHARYRGSRRFAGRSLLVAVGGGVLMAVLGPFHPMFRVLLVAFVAMALWALYLLLDSRAYLEISPQGIFYRPWGNTPLPFEQFKAAYARATRQSLGLLGVTLVPYSAEAIRPLLSWYGRYLLKSGAGMPAHAGTLTVWTTRVDLNQEAFLRGVQAELLRAARTPLAFSTTRPDGSNVDELSG